VDKCEIITDDFTEINTLATFSDFIRVNKEDMTLLGAPVLKGKAQRNGATRAKLFYYWGFRLFS